MLKRFLQKLALAAKPESYFKDSDAPKRERQAAQTAARRRGAGKCWLCHRKHQPSAHRFHGYRVAFVVR